MNGGSTYVIIKWVRTNLSIGEGNDIVPIITTLPGMRFYGNPIISNSGVNCVGLPTQPANCYSDLARLKCMNLIPIAAGRLPVSVRPQARVGRLAQRNRTNVNHRHRSRN